MKLGSAKYEAWKVSEAVLDLFQEKLLKLQKFFDLSVSERDALQSHNLQNLLSVLEEKSQIQDQIVGIDEQIDTVQTKNNTRLKDMARQQSQEFTDSIQVMVNLLQKIIDYEEQNKLIAITVKKDLQEQLNAVNKGDKVLNGYFNRLKPNPRFVDQAR